MKRVVINMFIPEYPIHIAKDADISPLVLMPGDPLRAKYIADTFLTDVKEVTHERNMLGFTGLYNGVKVTVMGSGMGMPSASIYTFELFHYFNVQKIIRIGTCGALSDIVGLKDIILASSAYTESNFAYTYSDYKEDIEYSNEELNNNILLSAKELNKNDIIHEGMIMTTDVFGPYIDYERVTGRIPEKYNVLGEDMESFAIFHIARLMGKSASSMVSVVNSKYSDELVTSDDREKALNDMILIALNAIIK